MSKMLLKWLLRLVNNKPSPQVVTTASTDEEQMRMRDYFTLYFGKDDGSSYLFKGITLGKVKALEYEAKTERYQASAELALDDLRKFDFECIFYYKLHEFTYRSLLWMFLHYTLRIWWISATWDDFAQWLFNKKSLPIVERHRLMSYIVTEWSRNQNFRPSPFSRGYGLNRRMWRHPDVHTMLNRERILLDSLVATQDLARVDNGTEYRVLSKIVASLEALDTEERRNRTANRIQVALFAVAFAAAFAGAVQAWVAYFDHAAKQLTDQTSAE